MRCVHFKDIVLAVHFDWPAAVFLDGMQDPRRALSDEGDGLLEMATRLSFTKVAYVILGWRLISFPFFYLKTSEFEDRG